MASSDLDAPARVSCLTAVKSPFGSLRYCVPAFLVFSFVLLGVAQSRAQAQQEAQQKQNQKKQDIAEAARQERARKESQQKKSKHVYTAEDLKHEHILTPEDRAQLEARKNQQPSTPANAQPQDAVAGTAFTRDANVSAATPGADAASPSTNSKNVPLGDVARRLRKEKQSQQLQRSAEFHLPFADAPVLASPKAPAQPLVPPATVPPAVVNPTPRVVAPLRPFVKRSPFERPRVLPAPPVASAPRAIAPASPALAPAPSTPRVMPAPPPARVATSPIVSGKLMIVTVKPGDSLWKFAASRLGNGHRWQELLALNPGLRNPDVLQVGSEIVVPSSVAPPPAPARYTVRHGDTLWIIAETQLGHGSSWSCIAQANPDLRDANVIREGQVLLLPASCIP